MFLAYFWILAFHTSKISSKFKRTDFSMQLHKGIWNTVKDSDLGMMISSKIFFKMANALRAVYTVRPIVSWLFITFFEGKCCTICTVFAGTSWMLLSIAFQILVLAAVRNFVDYFSALNIRFDKAGTPSFLITCFLIIKFTKSSLYLQCKHE